MTRIIVKAVIGGLVVGALAFFLPKLLIGLVLFCIVIGAFHGCCGRHRWGGHHRFGSKQMFYLADRVRKMSDEEYEEFKTVFGDDCCSSGHHHHRHCCDSPYSEDECCKKTDQQSK